MGLVSTQKDHQFHIGMFQLDYMPIPNLNLETVQVPLHKTFALSF